MKDTFLNIRIAKNDLDKIKENAKYAQMTTTAYITKRGLDDGKIIILEDLKPVCHELRKIGTNLNQLTILSHQGKITCVNLTTLTEAVESLWQPLNSLTEKIRRIKR